jgi:pimeloyl-ACP methyl ester carboxylesterase
VCLPRVLVLPQQFPQRCAVPAPRDARGTSSVWCIYMPLSLTELEAIRDECLADDVDIDFMRMCGWSSEEAEAFFSSGGADAPQEDCELPLMVHLADGRQLSYCVYGSEEADATPVIYCHGNGNSRLFSPTYKTTEEMARQAGAKVVCFDRPGLGYSSPHTDGSYSSSADDIGQLAAALNLGRFALLGYSSGCIHALAAAALLPAGKVSALMLVASDGPYCQILDDVSSHDMFPAEDRKHFRTLVNRSWDQVLSAAKESADGLHESYHSAKSLLTEEKREVNLVDLRQATRQGLEGMARDSLFEGRPWPFALKPLAQVPTLVWHGENDDVVRLSAGRFVAQKLGVQLKVFDGEIHSIIRRKWGLMLQELVAAAKGGAA